MISAQEARAAGPIADYIAVSRELQAQIWKAVYRKENTVYLNSAFAFAGVSQDSYIAWYSRLVDELEALGYEVSAGGVVSW